MNSKYIALCLSLLFCSVRSEHVSCDWNRYNILSGRTLSLLRTMGEHTESMKTPFPHQLYAKIFNSKPEQQVRFLAEVAEQIAQLFDADPDAADWDPKKLDDFRNVFQERQLKELQSCAKSYPATRIKSPRKHFRKLKEILKNNSKESWEQIRTTVIGHLIRMDLIASNLRSKLKG
ncbi:interferon a3-like [Hoplias malabaricus]|uniref:interferon a3-like n=1 Tax=Hoplias malabaricus TaxID=27720 RepID=UPI0034618B41